MTNKELLQQAYAAFNRRDIDAMFGLMRDDVEWPNAMEGKMLNGKDAVREYWTHQWSVVNPHVEPVEVTDLPDGRSVVQVHQVVRTLDGAIISEGPIRHVYRIEDGLIARMDVQDDAPGNRFSPASQGGTEAQRLGGSFRFKSPRA